MQQQGGGAADSSSQLHQQQHQHQLVEEASPISSRPPAAANLEDFMRMSGGGGGGDEGGGPSGNRWPRQETLALLKIRSDMDAVFRDATVKGPLWEDVSRKLDELGYRRSAKKCKEKFENVHKYYKRTKEGRAGRQDGKTYKFFTELEAFHSATASATPPAAAAPPPPLPHSSVTLDVSPVSVGIPMPASSSRLPSNPSTGMFGAATQPPPSGSQPPSSAPPFFGVSFSSDSSAGSEYSQGSGDEESEDERETDVVVGGGSRKRKRSSSTKHPGMGRMMEFFEGLMKQVMQKQELMQQRFLEAIEKREQERMVREEAWKRQEMARLAREHELMAQERAIAASRDAAIVTFLQKITGQTIQVLPTATATVTVPTPPPPAAQPSPHVTSTPPPSQPPAPVHQQQPQQQQMIRQQHHRPQSTEVGSTGAEIVMAVPEQQVPPTHEMGGTTTATESPSSSRWPKAEVLALIKIRSGLEPRYQEAGPKGPLWEDISAAMLRQGFKRNAKRCKEKWENINKYYKKVKESNKSRPEDAKTCPYFHELDALYRQKILGGGSSTSAAVNVGGPAPQLLASNYPQQPSAGEQQHHQQQQQQQQQPSIQSGHQRDNQNGNKNAGDQASKAAGSLFVEQGSAGQAHNKPEDLVRELMMEQQQGQPPFSLDDIDKMEEGESENMDEDDDEEDDDDDETDEERKMEAYKIEFQRQKGGGNSFLAMVHQ